MSNYIKYYKHKTDKGSEATHCAIFYDCRGKLNNGFDSYYRIVWEKINKNLSSSEDWVTEFNGEQFDEFIKDYEEVNV